MLLSLENCSKSFGSGTIADNVSITLEEHEKVALIGKNGTGKSTLLKILAGQEDFSGSLQTKRGIRIALLEQNPVFHEKTIWQEVLKLLHSEDSSAEEYEAKSILNKLELDDLNQPVETLSGGQKKRLALALVLLKQADLLLLDEPTNHLDLQMIEWLEEKLRKKRTAILLVSHDRYFLESLCTRMLELDHGKIYSHEGSYASYLEARSQRQQEQESRRLKENSLYRKELEWVRAGVQARGTKQKSRLQRFEQLRYQRNALLEEKIQLMDTSLRLGKKTISWQNLGFGYGEQMLFSGFSYTLLRNDRIGIVGPNGSGKSTFLSLIAQKLQPVQGTIEYGDTVRIGFFTQTMEEEDLNKRVLEYLEESASAMYVDGKLLSASQLLERFLFDSSQHYLPLSRLSGGERRRLYLLKILIQQPNVLLLDEPSNDLDLNTLEVLEDYLDTFSGIVITVCHDRAFLDRVCNSLFVLEDGQFRQYMGGYEEYLQASSSQKPKPARSKEDSRPKKKGLTFPEKRRMQQLDERIRELDREMEELNEEIGRQTDFEAMQALCTRRDALQQEQEAVTLDWMELAERAEEA